MNQPLLAVAETTAVQVERVGAQPSVVMTSVPLRAPGEGEVTLRVAAAGLCFADVLMMHGMYPGTPKPPFTLGYDVVGRVEAVGPGVELTTGTLVAGLTTRGALGQRATVSAQRLVAVPNPSSYGESPTPQQAAVLACLPLNYVTAKQLLDRMASVQAGETVLVHGGAGGVGTAVADLARQRDLRVLGVCSGDRRQVVADFGATPIDRHGDVHAQVLAHTDGRGVDVVLDPVGGRGLPVSRACLASGGRLVSFGYAYAALNRVSIASVFLRQQLRVRAWRVLDRTHHYLDYSITARATRHPQDYCDDLATLLADAQAGRITPLVGAELALEEVPAAYEQLSAGTVRGKLVAVAPLASSGSAQHG